MSANGEQATGHALKPTATESAVAAIWRDVLQLEGDISPDNDFFLLGGDSLAIMMMLFRIKEDLAVDIPPATVLETRSLRALCAVIDATRIAETEGRASTDLVELPVGWQQGSV